MVPDRYRWLQHIRVWLVAVSSVMLFVSILCGTLDDNSTSRASEETPQTTEARIAQLIDQLGASQYATREKAQIQLERLGQDAFDLLNQARESDDIEIAMRARYLVRKMQKNNGALATDSEEVKRLLRGYGELSLKERRTRMEQLAALGPGKALAPLCRLVRYEESQVLSRRAALLVLHLSWPSEEADRKQLAHEIRTAVGASKRPAAAWLRAYANMREKVPDALAQWQPLLESEMKTLAQSSGQTAHEVVRDLLWWYADQLNDAGQDEQVKKVLQQSIGVLDGSRKQVLEAVDWFRSKKAWDLVIEAEKRFPDTFGRAPLLLYRLAESYQQNGQEVRAKEIARKAQEEIGEDPREHLAFAVNLQHDGMFHWAEVEYRIVVSQIERSPGEASGAVFYLSEMLHDLGRHREAGDVVKALLEQVDADPKIQKVVVTDLGRDMGSLKARMHYFYAKDFAKRKEIDKERATLVKAIESDPLDADVLIAMFRLPEQDEAWTKQTDKRILETVTAFREKITELGKKANNQRKPFGQRAGAMWPLASANNQLAWLVANTKGDFAEAIRCSLRSLQLRPNTAGYLDTLGRCYYANGDFAKAVESQEKAVAIEPHSPQLLSQLKLFHDALAKDQEKNKKTP